jgi:hypothetical protein
MNGKDLLRQTFINRAIPRPAFVPLIHGLAARIEQISLEEMTTNPSLWANALQKVQDLFKCDGVLISFDFTLLAEGCGCQVRWINQRPVVEGGVLRTNELPYQVGRMSIALETAKRLFKVLGMETASVAALTGPFTLAYQLAGGGNGLERIDEAKRAVIETLKGFCSLKPDLFLFMERENSEPGQSLSERRRTYATLWNIANYYQVSTALYVEGYLGEDFGRYAHLGAQGLIFGPSASGCTPNTERLLNLLLDSNVILGIALPHQHQRGLEQTIDTCLEYLRSKSMKSRLFFTTCGEVSFDSSPNEFHPIVERIKSIQL